MFSNELIAFLLTLIAGLATGIGSLLAIISKPTNKLLAGGMSLSAGVMVYLSFSELLVEANHHFLLFYSEDTAILYILLSFFGGILLVYLINKFIIMSKNPHQLYGIDDENTLKKRIFKTGILTAIIMSIHNFPEGLVTYSSSIHNIDLGLNITFAIALHNIPEGLAVAVPILYSTRSKKKAFLYSFLPGLTEPIGGLLGYFFLSSFFSDIAFGIIMASVAGIMIYISFDQLIPAAFKTKEYKATIIGLILGVLLMQLNLGTHVH